MYRNYNFNPFNPRPEAHEELDPRIDQMIVLAANRLVSQTETEVVDGLVALGASEQEAVLAVRAGIILAEARANRST